MSTKVFVEYRHRRGGQVILKVRPQQNFSTSGSGGTADALASGASWSNPVGVQIPASAPTSNCLLDRGFSAASPARVRPPAGHEGRGPCGRHLAPATCHSLPYSF